VTKYTRKEQEYTRFTLKSTKA